MACGHVTAGNRMAEQVSVRQATRDSLPVRLRNRGPIPLNYWDNRADIRMDIYFILSLI